MANNRRAARKTIMRDGVLVGGPGLREFRCTIRDLSTTGAGVGVNHAESVPDTCFLVAMADRRAYNAIVVWRKPNALGLKFVSVIDLAKMPSREVEFLSRLWIERSRG